MRQVDSATYHPTTKFWLNGRAMMVLMPIFELALVQSLVMKGE